MKIAFASDDDNECVQAVMTYLRSEHELISPTGSTTWPTMSQELAQAVVAGECDFGVLMCWTGTGTAIAANKVRGARAATVSDAWTARGARLWNDANIVALSLKRLAPDVAVECVTAFLSEPEPDPEEAANVDAIRDL